MFYVLCSAYDVNVMLCVLLMRLLGCSVFCLLSYCDVLCSAYEVNVMFWVLRMRLM